MPRRIEWYEETERLSSAFSRGGAFLIARDADGRPNPMTIGWGQVGVIWSRPVVSVLVRESRFTHDCISVSDTFTVSVPRAGELTEALALCGSKSGRDLDKVEAASLKLVPGSEVETPVVGGCILYYECRVLARSQQTNMDFASDRILEQFYPRDDHHLVVFGEIVAAYITE